MLAKISIISETRKKKSKNLPLDVTKQDARSLLE
jgi:hypothetical protein